MSKNEEELRIKICEKLSNNLIRKNFADGCVCDVDLKNGIFTLIIKTLVKVDNEDIDKIKNDNEISNELLHKYFERGINKIVKNLKEFFGDFHIINAELYNVFDLIFLVNNNFLELSYYIIIKVNEDYLNKLKLSFL
ncbi:MAG: hypothetical protein QXP34_01895 [Candidatus Aenigmatarchaeota archaeon]